MQKTVNTTTTEKLILPEIARGPISGYCIRILFWLTTAVTLLFVVTVIATRFWLLPNADDFRPNVVEQLSRLTGQRVVIDGFQADWNGWSPELKMSRVRMYDRSGRVLLELPEVDAVVSWRSLLVLAPRLSELTIRSPRVVVRRTAENALVVAGIDVDISGQGDSDPALIEWLLQQRLVQISGGEIEWQDMWRKLPPVRLKAVNLRIINESGRHRIGLSAVPPSEFAAPLDIRSEFTGRNLSDIADWNGRAYLRVDYANLGLLARHVPLPVEIQKGDGGLQVWVDFDGGKPTSLIADIAVRQSKIMLPDVMAAGEKLIGKERQSRLEPLEFNSLSGRLTWQETTGAEGVLQQRWSFRDTVAQTATGIDLPLASGELEAEYRNGALVAGALRLSELDLALVTLMVRSVPLPMAFAEQLRHLQPSGKLTQVQLKWQQLAHTETVYEGSMGLQNVAWKRFGSVPGLTGLSGQVRGSPTEGALQLTSKLVVFDFGDVFEAPIQWDQLHGNIRWKRGPGVDGIAQMVISTPKMNFVNADVAGYVSGSWRSEKNSPGIADIQGQLSRANLMAISRYVPLQLPDSRAWAQSSILGGEAKLASITLQGSLANFPFHNDDKGVFEVTAQVNDGVLHYADQWPQAERIQTRLSFRGNRMEAKVESALLGGVPFRNVIVEIADLAADHAAVDIRGTANGLVSGFWNYVNNSPLKSMMGDTLQTIHVDGNGQLDLDLHIPFSHADGSRVKGELAFEGNRVLLGEDVPPLEAVSGKLRFSETTISATDITASVLGGATQINIATDKGGRLQAEAKGTAKLEQVRKHYDWPLLDQLVGDVRWNFVLSQPLTPETDSGAETDYALTLQSVQPDWLLDKLFQTNASARDVKQPLNLTVRRRLLARGRDQIIVEVPAQLHAVLERSAAEASGQRVVERAVLDLGEQKSALPTRGYLLRGNVLRFDGDALLSLLSRLSGSNAKSPSPLPAHATEGAVSPNRLNTTLIHANLNAAEMRIFNRRFHEVSLQAQPNAQRWQLAVRSQETSGLITIDTNVAAGEIDSVVLRLQKLSLPHEIVATEATTAARTDSPVQANRHWPRLDLVVDSFQHDGRDLGRLEVRALPQPERWRIDRVKLESAAGIVEAKGQWLLRVGGGHTQMDSVRVNWTNANAFMERFGMSKGVELGEGSLQGALNWPGSPADFSYSQLDGALILETTAGRFTELEPGMAKLLGVLSLQSLTRRLTLSFDDLFGKGFAFDTMKAEVKINKGVASTEGLEINGPSLRVLLRGRVDLNHETQHLKAQIFPRLTIATAVGIGFATANPAIGAVVLLGQKIARDPIERILVKEFEIGGTWAQPEVKALPSVEQEVQPSTESLR